MRTSGIHVMVAETQKTTNLRAHFFYNTFLYWLIYLHIVISLVYFQVGENKPIKQPKLMPVSFIKHFFTDLQSYLCL